MAYLSCAFPDFIFVPVSGGRWGWEGQAWLKAGDRGSERPRGLQGQRPTRGLLTPCPPSHCLGCLGQTPSGEGSIARKEERRGLGGGWPFLGHILVKMYLSLGKRVEAPGLGWGPSGVPVGPLWPGPQDAYL